jgi:flagellar protein FlaI
MAIDEADSAESGGIGESGDSESSAESGSVDSGPDPVAVGRYTWADFLEDQGLDEEVSDLYPNGRPQTGATADVGLSSGDEVDRQTPSGSDWNRVSFDPAEYLGFHPDDLEDQITEEAAARAKWLDAEFEEFADPETTPVVKDVWMWEHFKRIYYYENDGSRPRDSSGEVEPFDSTEYLSFDADETESELARAGSIARELDELVEERTVNVKDEVDEDEFFSDEYGNTTVTNRYDLEKAVPMEKKTHFVEEDRYWVNKPYAFVVLFHSRKENEKKYYAIEPDLNEIESDLREFLVGKLRTAIKYADEDVAAGADSTEAERRAVIERETKRLLDRYDLFDGSAAVEPSGDADGDGEGFLSGLMAMFENEQTPEAADEEAVQEQLDGIEVRPEPVVVAEDPETLSEYQIEKLLYLLKRDFIGYERIDPIKHDINVEDISCDGYNSPVFVYHTDYEQIISNIYHGQSELDDFVVKLAQRSGKGISKRRPQVDATLPDGSRAQLTLGREVSDHGTNYTIRQFKDVPFTPIDLINWNTFSLEEMAFLWLCIENHKSLIFAGGTASGKTTSLNAVSLFIPSNTKIVSIEDTREVELPQRNWIASVTRPSFSDDAQGDVDEFDLLEAALRQRPDYIVMGEIRGEEGRTLFQVMSTGHTTYTTFHADSVGEVLKRFTTEPINVSKTMFTALDLVSIQTQTRVHGHKVRRNKTLTEVNHYDAENDEINVQDVYQWQAETDEFLKLGDSNTLEEIKFDRGWNDERLQEELFKREIILAYLIKNGLNEYREVAATIQAFINDPDTILTLIANGQLEDSLEDLREMESVLIDVDPAKEELVPRPDPDDEGYNLAMSIVEEADESLFDDYRGKSVEGLETALKGVGEREPSVEPEPDGEEISFEGEVAEGFETEFTFGDDSAPFEAEEETADAAADASAADETDETAEDDPFAGGPDWLGGDGEETTEDIWAEAREALEGGTESAEADAAADADAAASTASESDAGSPDQHDAGPTAEAELESADEEVGDPESLEEPEPTAEGELEAEESTEPAPLPGEDDSDGSADAESGEEAGEPADAADDSPTPPELDEGDTPDEGDGTDEDESQAETFATPDSPGVEDDSPEDGDPSTDAESNRAGTESDQSSTDLESTDASSDVETGPDDRGLTEEDTSLPGEGSGSTVDDADATDEDDDPAPDDEADVSPFSSGESGSGPFTDSDDEPFGGGDGGPFQDSPEDEADASDDTDDGEEGPFGSDPFTNDGPFGASDDEGDEDE